MFFGNVIEPSYTVYQDRRQKLVEQLKKANPDIVSGKVLLFASFQKSDIVFRQNSSFYYFSGIKEDGLVITIDMDGTSKLFVPNCVEERKKWTGSAIEPVGQDAKNFGFEEINLLGQKINGLGIFPYSEKKIYENLLKDISDFTSSGGKLFVLSPDNSFEYIDQRFVLDRIKSFLPKILDSGIVDISSVVSNIRRKKDVFEIGKISEAINLTALAHESVAMILENDMLESQAQATVEYIFTSASAQTAYPTIVASGDNATILHYQDNCEQMKDGDLVIVDAGAKHDHYCADITRTYPVSGVFTERQKELYNIVLGAQKYIASIAKPGYYLKNFEQKDKCLTSLTREFFDSQGDYGKYFTHGIGHFLGLDVHDVGKLNTPLQEGDVITIEPALYIKKESIGIRIEDNYWITKSKAICLSEMIPKQIDQIQEFMKVGLAEGLDIE